MKQLLVTESSVKVVNFILLFQILPYTKFPNKFRQQIDGQNLGHSFSITY